MTKSADRKPEKYVGPDGKPKIRMVPVDKEVIKSEGGMKRIATTQANKADRMAAGDKKGLETFKKKTDEACWDSHKQVGMKKKGNKMVPNCVPKNESYSMKEKVCKSCGDTYGKPTNESCMYDAYDMAGENWCSRKEYIAAQKKNEANTYAGQRDKMKIINSKPHPDGGHIVTMQTKAGKTIKRHLKNGKVKDMKEEVNEISKKTAQSYLDKTKDDDAFSGTRKANNRLKGAIHAVGIKRKKESVDEVLDTPAAMDRYHNKAKAQSDRARNSATAKIVRGNKDISKEKDVIRKREKGMDMATNVRAKQFRKSIGRGYKGEATMKTFKQLKEDMDKIKKPSASERNVKISQSGRWSQYHGYAGKGATTHDMHDHVKEVAKEYPNHKGVQSTAKKHSEHITALHHAHMALKAAEDTMMKSKRELDKHALDARPAR
jgi:hypothetical protein